MVSHPRACAALTEKAYIPLHSEVSRLPRAAAKSTARVVVVGAGAAGLAATHCLVRSGVDTILLESSDRIGGRVLSCQTDGYTFDLGAQLLYSDYRTARALCKQLGLAGAVLPFPAEARIYHNGRFLTLYQLLDTWRKKCKIASLYLRLRCGRRLIGDRSFAHSKLHFETFAQHVRERFGQELLTELFQPFAASVVHDGAERLSAYCGLSYVRCAFGRSHTLAGGLSSLTRELARPLQQLHVKNIVRRVVFDESKVVGLDVEQDGRMAFLPTHAVIMATPAPAAAATLIDAPASIRDFLSSVPYSSSVHVFFGLDRPLLQKVYAVVVPKSSGLRVSCILEDAFKHPSFVPGGAGLAHVIIGGEDAIAVMQRSDDEIVAMARAELIRAVPSFSASIRFTRVARWPLSVCLCGAEHASAVRSFRRSAAALDGLHFAGEFLGVPSLESALSSGLSAAHEILRNLSEARAERRKPYPWPA
jgi:protoporphyrinogen/coproporphyrinogen III oxidase